MLLLSLFSTLLIAVHLHQEHQQPVRNLLLSLVELSQRVADPALHRGTQRYGLLLSLLFAPACHALAPTGMSGSERMSGKRVRQKAINRQR
jgi:hypothetical protein